MVNALGDSRRANSRNLSMSQNASLVSPRVLTAALGACEAAASKVAAGSKEVENMMEQQGVSVGSFERQPSRARGQANNQAMSRGHAGPADSVLLENSDVSNLDDFISRSEKKRMDGKDERMEAAAIDNAAEWLRKELATQA